MREYTQPFYVGLNRAKGRYRFKGVSSDGYLSPLVEPEEEIERLEIPEPQWTRSQRDIILQTKAEVKFLERKLNEFVSKERVSDYY